MVTGVETAGLVLAAFPIVVDGLKHWLNGVEGIRQWRHIRQELKNYAIRLESQRVTYLNTLEQLLISIVQSDEDTAAMLAYPGGKPWKNAKYDDLLQARLDRSYKPFLENSEMMAVSLREMGEKLRFEEGKMIPDRLTYVAREIKRVKVVLSKDIYVEKLDSIDRANAFLSRVTDQSVLLESMRSKKRSRNAKPDFRSIRQNAISLYNVIINGNCWKCKCKDYHAASLRLETRPHTIKERKPNLRFRLLMCRNHKEKGAQDGSSWRDVAVEPEPVGPVTGQSDTRVLMGNTHAEVASFSSEPRSGTARPTKRVKFEMPLSFPGASPAPIPRRFTLRPVSDICTAIFQAYAADQGIGYLNDHGDLRYRHHIYVVDAKATSKLRTTSLDHLLNNSGKDPMQCSLPRRHRLDIAATLASSVLQLDNTPWLKSRWTSSDVCFYYGEEDMILTSKPTFPPPYLCWKLSAADSKSHHSGNSPLSRAYQVRSEALLTLGIVLVELCFGRTLAEMQIPEDVDQSEDLTRLNIAIRKLDDVYNESGGHYGDVVRRCLFCTFDTRETTFENEEFEQDVFERVVTPLIEDLEHFDGKRSIT